MQIPQARKQTHQFDPHRRSKYNIFMYRMKRNNNKRTINHFSSDDSSKDFSPNMIPNKYRQSMQKLLNMKQVQKNKGRQVNHLILSEQNLRQNLSTINRKNLSIYAKFINKVGFNMPEIAESKKNKNNISIMLSQSYKRPLWKSLQMHIPKKNLNSNSSRCNLFKKMKQQENTSNPQIQFYNTSNIFIFKKINSKIREGQLPINKISSQNSAYIKYKRSNFQPVGKNKSSSKVPDKKVSYTMRQQNTHNLNSNNNIKMAQKSTHNEIKFKNRPSNMQSQKQINNKQKSNNNTFFQNLPDKYHLVQGVYNLQPWNINADQQGSHFPRVTPLN